MSSNMIWAAPAGRRLASQVQLLPLRHQCNLPPAAVAVAAAALAGHCRCSGGSGGGGRALHSSVRACAQKQQQQPPASPNDRSSGSSNGSGSSSSSGGEAPATSPPINKQVVSAAMDSRLYAYLLDHTREPALLADLRRDTAQQFPSGARMQVSPEQGAFLGWLAGTLRAARVIEVGVFTGYSSLAVALALPPGGRLVACDRDPRAMQLAREYWGRAGVTDKIEERLGPAAETLESLLADPLQHNSYDFAFIDADKKGYRGYYEQLLRLVRPGGVIAVDNVLWYGRVADPGMEGDGATAALRELNAFLLGDPRVAFSLVPVGDGMALCTKR